MCIIYFGQARNTASSSSAGSYFADYYTRYLARKGRVYFSSAVRLKKFMRCFTSFLWWKGSD